MLPSDLPPLKSLRSLVVSWVVATIDLCGGIYLCMCGGIYLCMCGGIYPCMCGGIYLCICGGIYLWWYIPVYMWWYIHVVVYTCGQLMLLGVVALSILKTHLQRTV